MPSLKLSVNILIQSTSHHIPFAVVAKTTTNINNMTPIVLPELDLPKPRQQNAQGSTIPFVKILNNLSNKFSGFNNSFHPIIPAIPVSSLKTPAVM